MIKLSKILSELEVTDGYKYVEGHYRPRNEKEIRELESLHTLEVTGYLRLSNTQINRLPDNLKVGGDLYLMNTQIKELPDNLQVGKSLHISGTQIKRLPDNIKVGRRLDISGSSVNKLPDNLEIGDFYLDNTPIKELPNNLQVTGNFYYNNTPLAEKYASDQIKRIVRSKGGYIKGRVSLEGI